MNSNQTKAKINRILSILLIYVFFINELIPLSRAINSYGKNYISIDYSGNSNYLFNKKGFTSKNVIIPEVNNPQNLTEKTILPTVNVSNSAGPGQAETSGFSINSTDGMVDKFTGDFSYSIPLMDVEGYPIVMSYNSNVNMLQDASWVGLGWDLNVGSISREMRGIPDEFNGTDEIVRTYNQLNGKTLGGKVGGYFGLGVEIEKYFTPSFQITTLFGDYTDNYLGLGKTVDIGLQAKISIQNTVDGGLFVAPTFNFGLNYDSKGGIGRSQSIGVSAGYGSKEAALSGGANFTYGSSYNSRRGLYEKTLSIGASAGFAGRPFASSGAYGASSSITYGTATTVPRIQISSKGSSDNFEFDLYLKIKKNKLSMRVGYVTQNYSSNSSLILDGSKKLYQPAYGYFHSGKRASDLSDKKYPIMDFNRSTDGEFSEEMKNLAFSIQTHDIFYVNASGIGSTFRPQRRDYGTYYDANSESSFNKDSKILVDDDIKNVSSGFIYDVSKPQTIGFGVGYSSGTMKNNINSGNWNNATNVLEFESEPLAGNNFDNSIYFRSIGEQTPVDMTVWNDLNNASPENIEIVTVNDKLMLSNSLSSGTNVNSTSLNVSTPKTYSATIFEPKTVEDVGVNNYYENYQTQSNGSYFYLPVSRSNSIRKLNHLSVVEVTSSSGVNYTYGIPVYNYTSDQVSFACEGRTVVLENGLESGLVNYNTLDNSPFTNVLGRSNFYEKTATPAYAHSFLLTEMKGSDYIDRTGDGPTLDDVGSYYKFSHTRFYDDSNPYRWRFPISGGTGSDFPNAMLAKGVLGSELDDIAHYSYGEKEIWYTHSIESKNLIAEFILENRNDVYGVLGEDGVLDTGLPLQALKKIILYNRNEKLTNPSTAIPLQTIEFVYDYSLCQKAPGNPNTYSGSGQSGKLTLLAIHVYNGNSDENALSSYRFEYGTGAENPNFSYNNIDAWGCYKQTTINKPNDVFPYAIQDVALADQNSRAWKIKAINNPMGGRIEVDYEADRYAYVQNKRAMRHFDIYGMMDIFQFLKTKSQATWDGSGATYDFHRNYSNVLALLVSLGEPSSLLDYFKINFFNNDYANYMKKYGKFDIEAVPNNIIVFELEDPISSSQFDINAASNKVKDDYFKDPSSNPNAYLKKLLFKMHVNIKSDVQELVPATVEIADKVIDPLGNTFTAFNDDFESIGVMPEDGSGLYKYGYVVLDLLNTGNREKKGVDKLEDGSLAINPLQLMSLEFARQYLLDKVYGSCVGCDPNLAIDWRAFFGNDIYRYMIKKGGYAKGFLPDFSTLRLFEPDNVKLGGNARVTQIRYFDNWDEISEEYASNYSWTYKYTKPGIPRLIETGVASFEGRAGMDENSLYNWDTYVNIKKKFPDERKFTPTPVAHQLYPKNIVGYEQVEVIFNNQTNYGYSQATFHTSKDHITLASSAPIDKTQRIRKKKILTGETKDLYSFTQGYSVETNDFHGKPNETKLFDSQYNLISRSTYNYYNLGELIPMVNREGGVENLTIATEYDIHADSRYISDKMEFNLIGLNLELYWPLPSPIPYPVIGPIINFNTRERGFYSHTLIKHINRSAVVKSITTEYLGSVNTAENILRDKYSGQVILSSLNDEFEDKLYNMSYPSHWKYKELRDLHEVNGTAFSISMAADGTFIPAFNDLIGPGDQISVSGLSLVVGQSYPVPDDGSLYFIHPAGAGHNLGAGNYTVTIINSNRKNRLAESMQSIVSKKSVYDIPTQKLLIPTEVISSSAVKYRDRLNILCTDTPCENGNNNEIVFGSVYNPYSYGVRANLIIDGQYAWQAERINQSHEHGIRFDGTYSDYIPFYEFNSTQNKWLEITHPLHSSYTSSASTQKWRQLSQVTVFDEYGKAIESRDQIGVYSSVLYGYGSTFKLIPIAQAVNARQQDIAFDGFEDYNYQVLLTDPDNKGCPVSETHFDFKEQLDPIQGIDVTESIRHSGLSSLKLPSAKEISVTKSIGEECLVTQGVDTPIDPLSTEKQVFANDYCACIKPFEPGPGNYIIGAWVYQGSGQSANIKVSVSTPSNVETTVFSPSGTILDGWKRLEGEFTIPVDATSITVTLNNANSTDAFFDDLRIHPFLAGMTTVVYDPKTLLPIATHDGYNFTTFYNYDENLNQVRVRVETIEGIKTITESESGGQKNY